MHRVFPEYTVYSHRPWEFPGSWSSRYIMWNRNPSSSAKEPFDLQSLFLSFRQTQWQDLSITSELLFRATQNSSHPIVSACVWYEMHQRLIDDTRTKLLKIMFPGSEGFHFREEGEEEQLQQQQKFDSWSKNSIALLWGSIPIYK